MTSNKMVVAHLSAYTPRSLTAAEWDLAAESVRQTVLTAEPVSKNVAGTLASALCSFLAGPCGWRHDGAPDLASLLTERAISAHVAVIAKRSTGSAGSAKSYLKLLSMAAKKVAARNASTRSVRARAQELYDAAPKSSLRQWNAAHFEQTGKPLSFVQMTYLVDCALALRATATTGLAGTVSSSSAVDAVLTAPNEEPPMEAVPDTTTKPTSTPQNGAGRKQLSQRTRLKRDRENRRAHELATKGPVLAPEPDQSVLSAEVRAKLASYAPQTKVNQALWAYLRPLTIRMVVGYHPKSAVDARNACTTVMRYLIWVWNQPLRPNPAEPPSAEEVLKNSLVEVYITGLQDAGTPGSSMASIRSILRRAVRSLDADYQDHALPREPVAGPYTPVECQELVELALNQPTKGRTRVTTLILGLALGAGLSSRDLRYVRCRHITENRTDNEVPYLTVTVAGDLRPRTVIIRNQYADLVRYGLSLCASPDDLVLGKKIDRPNVKPTRHNLLVTADGSSVPFNINRLRTTWLFALMNAAVPLVDLLAQAGLSSARTLADLLPLCPTPAPHAIAAAMTKAIDAPVTQVTK